MRVLGISGRFHDAAAAVSVDGRLVAAAAEDVFTRVPGAGYAQTGGFPARAVQACLAAAGCVLGDVDEVALVAAEGSEAGTGDPAGALPAGRPVRLVDAIEADAAQAAHASGGAAAVLVCSSAPSALAAFTATHDGLRLAGRADGAAGMGAAARALAAVLGVPGDRVHDGLDRLSQGGEASYAEAFAAAVTWQDGRGVAVDPDQVAAAATRVAGQHAGGLGDAGSLNQRVQDLRRHLAASFTRRMAEVVHDAARTLLPPGDDGPVALGGDLLAQSRFRAELLQLLGRAAAVAPVPEAAGRVLGAVLAPGRGPANGFEALALGPVYSDADIKRTLDNCRLDYVYEPDWGRLQHRVSRMLEQGKVVGWFQGALAFGPRALGTRSILCDPSNRYARQNVNEYLRQAPLDEPLPVVLAPGARDVCADEAAPLSVSDAAVRPEWREPLRAALDWRQAVRRHGVGRAQAPELCDLLEYHRARTGVPGLIEVNLAGPGEPIACTPRDAVRTTYSSAIDALVIGRFVLMKDHWLLRSHVD
ncbi:MAG: carbamoyltransferase C-terminal domain-containing protein [Vicinamibacterales bacterium]